MILRATFVIERPYMKKSQTARQSRHVGFHPRFAITRD
jgi:hypothetical protein